MKLLLSMIKKELFELIKSYKILVVPIVFMVLGAMQPLTYYYMPDILKMATLPEGTILQIPLPTPSETMVSVVSQINQIGLFILVLVAMGAIANEVKSGVAETVLVKPIPPSFYLLSKWIAFFLLTILSVSLGLWMGQFYTVQLIGSISGIVVLKSIGMFSLYMLFVISLTLFFSSIVRSSILAGGISLIIAIFLSILASLPFNFWYLPSQLLRINQHILYQQSSDYLLLSLLISIIYIAILFLGSVTLFKNKSQD